MGQTERRMAEFIVETSADDIPQSAYAAANRGIFDCIGVTLAGVAHDHGQKIIRYAVREGGTAGTSIIGTEQHTSPSMAALANGTLAHALDFDDGGGFGHPSAVLAPAALSIAEPAGASGRDVLAAYIVGFEVGTGIAKASRYVKNERGFHSMSMFGTLAATGTAARLLGLTVDQTVMALGIAGSMASGVLHNFGTHTKPLHAGLAARAGVMAAQLAKDDWLAGDSILENKVGFASAYIGNGNYDTAQMVAGLGTTWTVETSLSMKKHPCCFSNHSTIDSLVALKQEHGFTLDDVEQVVVTGFPSFSHVMFYPDPSYAYQGKFSVHYNAAMALIDGAIDHDSFRDERFTRPEYREALAKLEMKVMTNWDPNWSAAPEENPVTVRLKDGRELTRATSRHEMLGSVSNPLSTEELTEKFVLNAGLVLPAGQVQDAVARWQRLDEVADIREAIATVSGSRVPA